MATICPGWSTRTKSARTGVLVLLGLLAGESGGPGGVLVLLAKGPGLLLVLQTGPGPPPGLLVTRVCVH